VIRWWRACFFCRYSHGVHAHECVWAKCLRAAHRSPNGIAVALSPGRDGKSEK